MPWSTYQCTVKAGTRLSSCGRQRWQLQLCSCQDRCRHPFTAHRSSFVGQDGSIVLQMLLGPSDARSLLGDKPLTDQVQELPHSSTRVTSYVPAGSTEGDRPTNIKPLGPVSKAVVVSQRKPQNTAGLRSFAVWGTDVQVQLLGQPISVGRPSGYVDPAAAQHAAVAAAKALEAFQVVAPSLAPVHT